MKAWLAVAVLFGAFGTAHAQAPGGAPSGSTGVCKDGTYSSAASKRGACAGHKGVKEWYATEAGAAPAAPSPAAASAAPPATVAPPMPMPMPMPKAAKAPTAAAPVAGGGAGQVWVNAKSKVYHCPGDRYYGKTKEGSYMTEQAATAAGNHADHGKACKPA